MAELEPDRAGAGRRAPGGPAKGDRRRQAILEAIETLLEKRSIARLSVEDIAAAAGISRSGFYFYFENKYAALAEALGDLADQMTEAADAFFAGSGRPAQEFTRDALAGVARLWRQHAPLMTAVVDASHSDAGARALWDAWRTRFVGAIAAAIDAERDGGRAPAGHVPARDLARGLFAANVGLFYEDGHRRVSDEDAERTVGTLEVIWLSSVWGIAP